MRQIAVALLLVMFWVGSVQGQTRVTVTSRPTPRTSAYAKKTAKPVRPTPGGPEFTLYPSDGSVTESSINKTLKTKSTAEADSEPNDAIVMSFVPGSSTVTSTTTTTYRPPTTMSSAKSSSRIGFTSPTFAPVQSTPVKYTTVGFTSAASGKVNFTSVSAQSPAFSGVSFTSSKGTGTTFSPLTFTSPKFSGVNFTSSTTK